MWRAIAFLLATAIPAWGQAPAPPLLSPADAVVAAAADVVRLPVAVRQHTRYFELSDLIPRERAEFLPVLGYQVNSLSREPDLVPLVPVTPDLLLMRVNICDCRWDRATWERLADADQLLHVRLVTEIAEVKEYGHYDRAGRWVTTERRATGKKTRKVQSALAPWLTDTPERQQALATLVRETGSQAPVVNGLWWFHQTTIQEGRDQTRTGYYDFLGLGKKEADWQALAGGKLVVDAAKVLKLELGAVVRKSRRVAINNRQIRRVQGLTGGLWLTLDVQESTDKRNALRNLLDLEPDATEQILPLPNGLPAFWLADGKGNRQNAAPDNIAGNTAHRDVDTRVHAGPLTCLTCHRTVLHPIRDYAREVLARPPLKLQSPDPVADKRLRQLYLSDLEGRWKRDVEDYAAATVRASRGLSLEQLVRLFWVTGTRFDTKELIRLAEAGTGLTPEELARQYGRWWDYYEADRDLDRVSRGVGVPGERVLAALRAQQAAGTLDPVLAGLLHGEPLRWEHWEEGLATLHVHVRGVKR